VKVNLFVYGTLRPGEYNYVDSLVDGAERLIQNAQANGRMFNVRGATPIFPVVNFDLSGVIVGDVLVGIDPTADIFIAVDDMEIGAGYEPRTIKVLADGEMMEAVAYHYPHSKHGIEIPDGDWIKFANGGEGSVTE
jgi:gamma-glutamylcyclotransferase (GGCT)/AIG2-like uncharacterized protein YtfP